MNIVWIPVLGDRVLHAKLSNIICLFIGYSSIKWKLYLSASQIKTTMDILLLKKIKNEEMSEHGPRMEFVWRDLGACKKTPRKQDNSLMPSVSSKAQICSSVVLLCLADKSEFASDYSLKLVTVNCLSASVKTCHCIVQLVLVTIHFTQVIILNPQSTNCLMHETLVHLGFGSILPGSTAFRAGNRTAKTELT